MQSDETTPASVAVARVLWMVAGPFVLLLLTTQIVLSGTGWLTPWDAAFGLTLVAMILARRYEFQAGDPRTSDGSPANIHDLRRYSVQVAVIGVAMWVIANALGNHVLHHAEATQTQAVTPTVRRTEALPRTPRSTAAVDLRAVSHAADRLRSSHVI